MSLLDLFGKDANFFGGRTSEQRARGAGQIAYESIPGISEAVTFRDIKSELKKDKPNYYTIGLLAGAGALGLLPFVGDIAGNAIRQGVKARNAVKLNPAQQQSQDIINLLKSGKANEVTDQMLANADQKYLFENYDLPMDTKSRMARAKEMGLTEDAFHGTDYDFKKFSNTYPTFTSNEPAVADTYTNKTSANMSNPTGMILPLRVPDGGNYVEIEGSGDNWSGILGSRTTYDPAIGDEDLNLIMLNRNPKMAEGNNFEGYTTKEITHSLRNNDDFLSGVIFNDIVDRGGSGYSHLNKTSKHNELSRVRAEFDPKNIRSRFARFDPRLKHLKNLSAGFIPIGLLPFLMNEEQQ